MHRSDRIVLLFSFLGPLIGGLTLVVPAAVIYVLTGSRPAEMIVDHWPPALILAYVLGIIPGFVTAQLTIAASRWLRPRLVRLSVVPIVGGTVSAAFLILTTLQGSRSGVSEWMAFALLCTAPGAIAAFVCMAITDLIHPVEVGPNE